MSAKLIKVKLNYAGVGELLKSQEVMDECSKYARQIVSNLGDGYEADTYTGAKRVNAGVKAVSYAAKQDNLTNNTLLKAIGNL